MGKLEVCKYVKCGFHVFEERLNVWLSCLFDFFFFPSCSATVLNASPSAHDQSAAALRRPPARHLAALRLFLEALLFAQSPPTGG